MNTPQNQQIESTVMRIAAGAASAPPSVDSLEKSTLPAASIRAMEFDIPPKLRERWSDSFVARYGDFQSWDQLQWSRQLSTITAQLRKTETPIINRDTGEALLTRPLRVLPGSPHDEHQQAFGHLALVAAYGETMGFYLHRVHEEFAPYWRSSLLRSIAPATDEIFEWFSGGNWETAPDPTYGNLSSVACLEAIRTQFRSFFTSRGEFGRDRQIWETVIERISISLPDCIDYSEREPRERVDRTTRELLLQTYQHDHRFRGTLAAKVAHDELSCLERRYRHEDDWDQGARGHLERARNRSSMFGCMVSAVTQCELRTRPDGPHHDAIKFLQRVRNSVKAYDRDGVPELESAIEELQENGGE